MPHPIVQSAGDAARLRIGLGVRTLCNPAFKGQIDGLGVYTRELWRRFDAAPGLEVHPVVGFGKEYREIAAIHTRGYAFPLNYGIGGALSIAGNLPFPGSRALRQRIDVYHATDYWIPKLAGVPVVATLHDAIPLSHREWAAPRHRALKNTLLRGVVRWADMIITVSAAMVPVIVEQFRVAPERVAVIHNGVDEAWFQPQSSAAVAETLDRLGLTPGYFLTVGTLQPRKNLARVLAAHRALSPRIREERPLVIVGRMGWGMDAVMPAIRAGQAAGELFWLDYVTDTDLRAIFQAARALVFPSLYEGFGMPVVEAFAAGVPVLTSNVSALPEVAGDAALQVDPLDAEAIRDGMSRVADDDGLCASLSAAGSVRAAHFSWQTCADQVVGVYRKLS